MDANALRILNIIPEAMNQKMNFVSKCQKCPILKAEVLEQRLALEGISYFLDTEHIQIGEFGLNLFLSLFFLSTSLGIIDLHWLSFLRFSLLFHLLVLLLLSWSRRFFRLGLLTFRLGLLALLGFLGCLCLLGCLLGFLHFLLGLLCRFGNLCLPGCHSLSSLSLLKLLGHSHLVLGMLGLPGSAGGHELLQLASNPVRRIQILHTCGDLSVEDPILDVFLGLCLSSPLIGDIVKALLFGWNLKLREAHRQ
mmetsp:Transcript_14265/g.33695  ORF Transcript_14265/g.33695 Transcript_14265/m.33695 type:complete len:251 (-) Transcript_14265:288-1040(-)